MRTFTYNSLSWLTSAANPESGTINYGYDNNGNLTLKTDARGVRTDYFYDALNRVTNRNYSLTGSTPPNYQASPNVTYTYDDPSVANSKGKLTRVANSVSETKYTGFDIVGRVSSSQQITDGTAYTTGYVYNLSGALIEQTYPSGRVVKNTLENDGQLQQVQSRRMNDTLRNYANAFTYNAAGAVTALRLGSGKWETTQFNSRLQPTQIGLGTSATNQGSLKLNYDYGTTDNNGNVKSQIINTGSTTFTQTYLYDSLNRLTEAKELNASNQQTWKQNFGYDRFGNRTTFSETILNPDNTTTTNNQTPQIDAANNRFTTATGFAYDLSGNVITDNQGRTFNYDSENKQTSVSSSSGTIGTYLYDGDGKRIKKVVPNGETTVFVYDAAGKSIAEYSTVIEPTSTAKTSYLTNDHLGSPRITTDGVGQVISRRDFRPFGEQIIRANYGSDSIRQKFTGYERDTETSLDFAEARYLSYGLGRFQSPDDFLKDTVLNNPQTWNKYIYVRNNPLLFVDPDGEKADVVIETDKKKKTGTITVKATIAIYAGKGGVSKENMLKAKGRIEGQINRAWSGEYKQGGITYTVKTEVSVKIYDSKQDAEKSGAQNVIGMVEGNVDKTASSEVLPTRNKNGPDYGTFNALSEETSEYAHEFGHLLGVGDRKSGPYLMNNQSDNPDALAASDGFGDATQSDFGWAFSGAVRSHLNAARRSKQDVFQSPRPFLLQTPNRSGGRWR